MINPVSNLIAFKPLIPPSYPPANCDTPGIQKGDRQAARGSCARQIELKMVGGNGGCNI